MSRPRRISVGMPRPTSAEPAKTKAPRFQPTYSLNSIQVNPDNPRKPDLESAGINVESVKLLKKRPSESTQGFEQRVSTWIEDSADLDDDQKGYWHRFLNFAVSIKNEGLLQPIAVRESSPKAKLATIIAGERRFLAHWLIGETTIAAMVNQIDDEEASMLSLMENIQREGISLNATVQGFRLHKKNFGSEFTMAEIAQMANVSKGGSQGIYLAVNAADDDPVLRKIESGEFTRPYHIKKYFDEIRRPAKKEPSKEEARSEQDGDWSNLTTDERGAEQETPQEETNRIADADTDSSSNNQDIGSQSNLTTKDRTDQNQNNTSSSEQSEIEANERTEDHQTPKQQNTNVSRSNLTKELETINRERLRDFLAVVCLKILRMETDDYKEMCKKIYSIETPSELQDVMVDMARAHSEINP